MATLQERANAFLREISIPIARRFNLKYLPDHFHTVVYAALAYTILHLVIAPSLSQLIVPDVYKGLKGRKARNRWCV